MKREEYNQVNELINEYTEAKASKNKDLMNEIKIDLMTMGIRLTDTNKGVRWETINQVSREVPQMSKLRTKLIQLLVGKKYGIMMNMTLDGGQLQIDKPSILVNNHFRNVK